MTDVGSLHFIKAHEHSDRVLVPQPSMDPHDPLVSDGIRNKLTRTDMIILKNWTPMWKAFTLFNALLSAFAQGFGPLAMAPQFNFYIAEFNSTLADVVQFVGVCILVLGFSNLIW